MNILHLAIAGVGIITVILLAWTVLSQNEVVESGSGDMGGLETKETKDRQPTSTSRLYEVGILGGSGGKGCEEIKDCYYPKSVTVFVGEIVFWNNIDDATHTVTSGNSVDGHDGIFDSDLIFSGSTFGYMFSEAGTFDYYCILHPWMEGKVTAVESSEHAVTYSTESVGMPEVESSDPLLMKATVLLPFGTSIPGCDMRTGCFVPSHLTVSRGATVSWINEDSGTHTVTSGTVKSGPTDMFDTGLFLGGETFHHTFESAGKFDYYCKVHPWMTGTITVR